MLKNEKLLLYQKGLIKVLKINNRRYIGSKTSLVDRIFEEVNSRMDGDYSFADIFAGTGVVASKFSENNYKVFVNDNLYSNYISYVAWFSEEKANLDKVNTLIDKYNQINPDDIENNYFSKIYGKKYYSVNDAKVIGFIRDQIENEKDNLNFREYAILLTSLMYAADRIANTVGHFEHFLSKRAEDKGIELRKLDISNENAPSELYQMDANELVREIKADVVYIDPPYNARQYVNFYHVLENLVTWEKPTKFQGTSMKFMRDHLKSGYSRAAAKDLLADLIENTDAKLIVLSYNNTYRARSTASNNKIKEKYLISILEKKGDLEIIEIDHKFFNSGKTNFKDHKELLYICRVRKEV